MQTFERRYKEVPLNEVQNNRLGGRLAEQTEQHFVTVPIRKLGEGIQ